MGNSKYSATKFHGKKTHHDNFLEALYSLTTYQFLEFYNNTLTCSFLNAENLQCQKLNCQKLLLSQKLTSVDFRLFTTCAFRVISMVN